MYATSQAIDRAAHTLAAAVEHVRGCHVRLSARGCLAPAADGLSATRGMSYPALGLSGGSQGGQRPIDSGADQHAPDLAILRRRPVREAGGGLPVVPRRAHLDRHARQRCPAARQGRLVGGQDVGGAGHVAAGVVEVRFDAGREGDHAGHHVRGHAHGAALRAACAAHLDASAVLHLARGGVFGVDPQSALVAGLPNNGIDADKPQQ